MKRKGVIYILTNPAFPHYVKIGWAQDLEKRLKQLNRSETIPYAFRAYAVYDVESELTDKDLHAIIDSINPDLRKLRGQTLKIALGRFGDRPCEMPCFLWGQTLFALLGRFGDRPCEMQCFQWGQALRK